MKGQASQQPGFNNKSFLSSAAPQRQFQDVRNWLQTTALKGGNPASVPGTPQPQTGVSAGAGTNAQGFVPPGGPAVASAPVTRMAPQGGDVNAQGWMTSGGPGPMASPGVSGSPPAGVNAQGFVPPAGPAAASAGAGPNAQGFIPPAASPGMGSNFFPPPRPPVGLPGAPGGPADMTSALPFQGPSGLPTVQGAGPTPSSLAMALNPYLAIRSGGFGGVPFAPLVNRYGGQRY